MYAKGFRELDVYKMTRQFAHDVFLISKRFPKEEMYSLTDQIRRSSRSVGAQIAEAWGKRRYEAHFISKLSDGDAEQLESQNWIEIARDCDYLRAEDCAPLLAQCESIGRMLNSMIAKASLFCDISKKETGKR
jgi:four helix bundle protein